MDRLTISRGALLRRASLLLAVVAATLVVTLAGPGTETGVSPRPAEAASAVTVAVNCTGNPEVTRVTNNTRRSITVRTVGSIHQPRSNEPFRMNRALGGGRTIAFESGYAANQNTLTRQYIYDNEVGSREGARVYTSAGGFVDRC